MEKILQMWDSGKTINEIIKETGKAKSTIRSYLIKNNRKMFPKGYTKSKVKLNPFSQHTSISDYWLGYLIADGNISKNSNFITLFTVTDPNHLEKFKNLVGNLKTYKKVNSNGAVVHTIGFGSFETKEYLISLGITPNKSLTLDLKIPLNVDILRGVFDGDGSCAKQIKITTGSEVFANKILEYFLENNLQSYIKTKGNCFDVIVRGKSKILFYNLIYKDKTLYLERKHDKLRSVIEKSIIKNIG